LTTPIYLIPQHHPTNRTISPLIPNKQLLPGNEYATSC